ncbi:hypothetical protein L1887_59871 [Cichorium endivia]|nr:hypothetical protein L1887_59871 [Cichorium endivia]
MYGEAGLVVLEDGCERVGAIGRSEQERRRASDLFEEGGIVLVPHAIVDAVGVGRDGIARLDATEALADAAPAWRPGERRRAGCRCWRSGRGSSYGAAALEIGRPHDHEERSMRSLARFDGATRAVGGGCMGAIAGSARTRGWRGRGSVSSARWMEMVAEETAAASNRSRLPQNYRKRSVKKSDLRRRGSRRARA